jgi:large subunit ribosomal protein L3
MEGILGKKLGMTQIFGQDGTVIPVTVIQAGPCLVVQRKTVERDGYEAVQVGFVDDRAPRHVNKAQAGHFAKAGVTPTRHLEEFKLDAGEDLKSGDAIKVEMFAVNQWVDVVGTSKGKGFQGVVKRHHFRGGRASHGSMFHRAPGSIGSSSFPSRVFPGMRAAGRMGGARITTKNLLVVKIDAEKNLLYLRGSVPGAENGFVAIRRAKRG